MNTALIKQRMEKKGWDTAVFADRCLVAERYMDQILKGLTPSKRLVVMMARELELDPKLIAPEVILKPAKRKQKELVR